VRSRWSFGTDVLAELDADSALRERLLASRDRLLKMLTYRALELRRARVVPGGSGQD
jgi:hypothetical protein